MLDIKGVINEVSVDQLEAKQERIKKLREEFNEIKYQFSSQQQIQTVGKDPNKSSTRRLETISRDNATQAADGGGVRKSFVKS